MDKLTITTKLDIKAGTTALVDSRPIEMKDVIPNGAPVPLYSVLKQGTNTIKIAPCQNTPDGNWVVTFLLITSDTYDNNITYEVTGEPKPEPKPAPACDPTGKPQGQHAPAQESPGSKAQDYSSYDTTSSPSPSPPTPTARPRVFALEFPHLFLGQGAVQLLSAVYVEKSKYFEPQEFKFSNGTDNTISVSIYVGRTLKPKVAAAAS